MNITTTHQMTLARTSAALDLHRSLPVAEAVRVSTAALRVRNRACTGMFIDGDAIAMSAAVPTTYAFATVGEPVGDRKGDRLGPPPWSPPV